MAATPGTDNDVHTRVSVLERLTDEREKALNIQAKEYERRLEALNHAHEQQVERNSEYVSREIWDAFQRSTDVRFNTTADSSNKRYDAFDKRMGELENWRSRATGAILGAMTMAGLIGGGLGALLMRMFK